MSMYHQLRLDKKQKEKLQKIWDTDYKTIVSGSDNGVPFLLYVFELHKEIFNESCSTCPNKIEGYITNLKKLNTIEKMENTEKKFVLNAGTTIPVLGTSDAYSNANLTDEKAIALLAVNKNRIVLFKEKPENWETLVDDYISKYTKVDELEFVEFSGKKIELKTALEAIEKIGLKTRATTPNGVEKFLNELEEEKKNEFNALFIEVNKLDVVVDPPAPAPATAPGTSLTKDEIQFEIDKLTQEAEELAKTNPDAEELAEINKKIEELKQSLI